MAILQEGPGPHSVLYSRWWDDYLGPNGCQSYSTRAKPAVVALARAGRRHDADMRGAGESVAVASGHEQSAGCV